MSRSKPDVDHTMIMAWKLQYEGWQRGKSLGMRNGGLTKFIIVV